MILRLFIAVLQITASYCIDCYQCIGIRNITDCHHVSVCSADEYCFTDASGIGDQTRYSLGCRNKQTCLTRATTTSSPVSTVAPASTTSSSVSIVGRATTHTCSQCCAIDTCNKQLCTIGTHAVGPGDCADDPKYNCAQTSMLFNLCGDIDHAKLVCRKFCGLCKTTDGQWSDWSSWSSCDVTCDQGIKARSRTCDNPAPHDGGLPCPGSDKTTTSCNLRTCPVHGGWSRWAAWGSCSVTCGIGLKRRDRSCSNPYPGPDGNHCYGDARDDRACFVQSCADGVWSSWSSWGTCSATCLGGIETRSRTCNNPAPSTFGHDCVGNDEETQSCNSILCPVVNGRWTSWASWSACSMSCNGGKKIRTRTCTEPSPSIYGRSCVGNSEDKEICNTMMCPVVNGGWISWSSWSACSSFHCMKTRTRTCTNPAPSQFGHTCIGNTEDKTLCYNFGCSYPLHIRLHGANRSHGRVEVSLYGSTWGTVCDDLFSDNSAKVVCRMLGLPTSHAVQHQSFGGGAGGSETIFLDDVQCTGLETSLLVCNRTQWGVHDCAHSEDVGVTCA